MRRSPWSVFYIGSALRIIPVFLDKHDGSPCGWSRLDISPYFLEKSNALAKTNFQYEKRQKDLEKKRKKEEKLKKKADKSGQPEGTPDESGVEPETDDGTDASQTSQANEASDVEAIPVPAPRSNNSVE